MRSDGRVVTEREYRDMYPNTIFPQVLVPEDADAILQMPKPSPDSWQYVVEAAPVQDALGNWVQNWQLVEYTAEAYAGMLNAAKLNKLSQINSWREQANKTTFTHQGKVIQCDPLSRGDIDATANHVALFGTFPPNFPGGWKAMDNTIIYLPTIASFKDMYASMTAQGTTNFNRSQQLKAAVSAATTIEQVQDIVW